MKEWIIEDNFLDEESKASADGQGYLRELIRCKDCKHYNGDHTTCYNDVWSVENGYCWMAERKEE